jgi:ribosome-associated heat shock protein Hsp15
VSSDGFENSTRNSNLLSLRLDKWLWAARIFKTRAVAATAVAGGKVHLNAARVKPAHPVRPGDTLTIQRGDDELTIRVQALALKRGSAPVAAMLYEETEESRATRAQRATARSTLPMHSPHPDTRPTKKQRRALTRFGHKKGY